MQKVRLGMINAIKPIWNISFPYWGHFEDPNLLGLLRRIIWTKISRTPTIAKLDLWSSKRMVGIKVQSVWKYSQSTTSHEKCNKTHREYLPFPYSCHFEDPNLLGLLRRTIWTKISYVPTIAKLGVWASKRMVGGESLSNQFGDIQTVRLRMKNAIKPIGNASPSHIRFILRTLTCWGYYAELFGRKSVMYRPSRSLGYGLRNEWLVANHCPISLEIFKKYDFT